MEVQDCERRETLKLYWWDSNVWAPIRVGQCWSMMDGKPEGTTPGELSLLQMWDHLRLEKYLKWSWEDTQRMLAKRVTQLGFAHLLPGFWLLDSFLLSRSFLESAFSLWVSTVSFRSSTAFEILSYQRVCAQPAPVILTSPTLLSPHIKSDDITHPSGFIGVA